MPNVLAHGYTLSVVPGGERQGFRAYVRGHVLDLGDPGSYALAPTTDDLFVVSIATALAWSARTALRAARLPEDVSVSAEWRVADAGPSPADIRLKVTMAKAADLMEKELSAAFEKGLATRFLTRTLVHLSFEGVDR
jgi:uncharacterized OsmC-like protein